MEDRVPLTPKLIVQGVISNGAEIQFFVNGVPATCRESGTTVWKSSYPYTSGSVTNLDLNVGGSNGGSTLVADFSGNPTTGTAPVTVQFTDLSTGQHTQWSWIFGDGGTSTLQNPNHTYASGKFTVSLTVSDGTLNSFAEKSNYISISLPPSAGGGGGGGGGGGSGIAVTTTTSTTTKTVTPTATTTLAPSSGSLPLGSDNTTTQQVTILATDSIGSLTIGKGVAPVNASGQPLQQVFLTTHSAGSLPPGSPCTSTPYAYEIAPAGSTFTPAVALVLSFDEATWAGMSGNSTTIIRYNSSTGVWEAGATEIDSGARTVKAMVTKGGTYALCLNKGPETSPTTSAPAVTSPPTGSSGIPMDIVIPAVLLMIVVDRSHRLSHQHADLQWRIPAERREIDLQLFLLQNNQYTKDFSLFYVKTPTVFSL